MATGMKMPVCLVYCSVLLFLSLLITAQEIDQENQLLDVGPPVFNLAQGRNITASATCGVGVANPELYCRLTGAGGGAQSDSSEVIQGQLCDYCDPDDPLRAHPPENAIDGTEKWWQSPPLSRLGLELNRVNVTISLGQEFHVAYVFIKMANSPRPGAWVLERSTDYGKTWQPWQYFADKNTCTNLFKIEADQPLSNDSQVLCSSAFAHVVPLTDGEIVVSLVNGRPNAKNFSHAIELQEWTKATDIQLRLLRTNNLKAHLMEVARKDPTIFRRYYYSIKDISIGGQCVCNGHARNCDIRNPETQKLICRCLANTCGEQCEMCCPGFVQKRWRRALIDQPFECEPCNCHGHSNECIFDEDVESKGLSLDIYGKYEGGGVCQNCRDNTQGINCEKCVSGFYRPYGVPRNATDACRPCQCDLRVSTGECEEGSGRCLCREEYTGRDCDRCSAGYYGYPDCIPCDCDVNGTEGAVCTVGGGICPCKENYAGSKCDQCAPGFYNFPDCVPCACNQRGSLGTVCELESGQCKCQENYGSRDCGECAHGYYRFPTCQFCNCEAAGTLEEVCDKQDGSCLCKANYTGSSCDRCERGFFDYPNCRECQCVMPGALSTVCAGDGQCRCAQNFGGLRCDRCAPGYYNYPSCSPCNCNVYGSLGQSCDQVTGQCYCRSNFVGLMCDQCGENFYNYPVCEVCNCNPNGAKEVPGYPLGGCGTVTVGRLCECKERVQGRICDQCEPGYWNLDRNNPEGCEECGCHMPGTLTNVKQCNQETGQCHCKPYVEGRNCDRCLSGFYNLQENNPFGCVGCRCNIGGSRRSTCDKDTGQCLCKERVSGTRCDQPGQGYFVSNLHQYKYELEDGLTPEGARVRYGYDDQTFPEFSWRGYAILTPIQPEVVMDIEVRYPGLYQIIFRYVNKGNSTVKGTVTIIPSSPTDITQQGEVIFDPSDEPTFSKVTSGGIEAYVLNPGQWTISTRVPDNVFLDYFVLIPQSFYEASILQEKVTDPCLVSGDPGPCAAFTYPDLADFATVYGIMGITGINEAVDLYPDGNVTNELGSPGLAHLTEAQREFQLNLTVDRPDLYYIVVNYFNPLPVSQYLDVDVDVPMQANTTEATVTLASCPYSTLCRQVLVGTDGLEGIFNISAGYATLTFTASQEKNDEINVAIDSVYAIPASHWKPDLVYPRIICIKVNGVCAASSYGVPVGTILIQFEAEPNDDLRAIVLPPDIQDPSVGLVNLNDSREEVKQTNCTLSNNQNDTGCTTEILSQPIVPLELTGRVPRPGDYIMVVQYYMPTLPSLSIDVTVYTDGKILTGTFNPSFCPSVVGCRAAITFDQSGTNQINVVRLSGLDVRAIFHAEDGDNIWLDYLLIIPRNNFSPDYLDILPIDNSGMFIEKCVDEGFQLNTTDPFCQAGAFMLTTNFNNGALDCECNADGSLSFICDGVGGNCQCKDNVIGRRCSACAQDYYGFPNCRPCNCPYGLCHEVTGQCICPPNVEGEKCDRCKPGAYGYDPLIGCQLCNCNPAGTVNGDTRCDQLTGQCNCADNVGGRRCETCMAGFHSHPYCDSCGCDTRGTIDEICDQRTSECLCKANVQGRYCDRCSNGMFSLTAENPKGCIKCFCFGHTTRCDSAGLSWETISNMKGWNITNVADDIVNITMDDIDATLVVTSPGGLLNDTGLYWLAPNSYTGKKLNAYGGKLEYTVLFTLPTSGESTKLRGEDIILTGANMTMVHYHKTEPSANYPFKFEVELREYNFRHAANSAPVSREQFMMLLNHMDSLVIRGSYFVPMTQLRLKEVTMQVASEEGQGMLAESVEDCECPTSYMGMSCEYCAPGNYRARGNTALGICVPCDCNGHTDECDVNTGVCYNCRDNTTGPHCEQCLPGYHGDPRTGACSICSCPLPIPSNNFAETCSANYEGFTTSCVCQQGYTGTLCDSCAPGYFGNPIEVGSYCQPCGCSGNIDLRNPRSCDRFTGACLLCENNSAGLNCDQCRDWYFGDAILAKDCKPCTCDQCGTERCDNIQGICQCKPHVVGPDCDKCERNFWGFDYCTGCQDCECGVGSVSGQCDDRTGRCECQPGAEGVKCDRCMAGHWNLGPAGCQECDCLSDGAVGCDAETGKCQCLPGVTGPKCDRCLPRWVLVPNRGCQECDYCVHLLIDDLDALANSVSTVSRTLSDVSVGVGAFNRLSYYNETVDMLRPAVDDLYNLDSAEVNRTVDQLRAQLDNLTSEFKDPNERANTIAFEADELPKNVKILLTNVSELQQSIRETTLFTQDAVREIQDVNQQLRDPSRVGNLDELISRGERILEEMKARDFDVQNVSSALELRAAEEFLDIVKMINNNVTVGKNHSEQIKSDLMDIENNLRDLLNSSRYSKVDTDMAKNILNRLNAVQSVSLARSLDQLEKLTDEQQKIIEEAKAINMEAEEMITEAESNTIESQSSSLEKAVPELSDHVDKLAMVDDLTDLVNKSHIHANDLAAQVAELVDLYAGTKNRSEDPVKAGQAYQNIESGIAEAKAQADKAVEDANTAKVESDGINGNVSDALADSAALLATARDLLDYTKTDLNDDHMKASEDVDTLKDEHEMVHEKYDQIIKDFEKLNASRTKDQTMAVMSSVNKTLDTLAETERLSQAVVDKSKQMNENFNMVEKSLPKARDDIRQTDDNVNSVLKSQPKVKEMIDSLSDVAERVANKSRRLGLDVADLKEKIARARDEASRIKVALNFLGNTTVTLRNPPILKDTGSYTTVSFYARTDRDDGLLFYIGPDENGATSSDASRGKRSVPDMTSEIERMMEDEMYSEPMVRHRRQIVDVQNDYFALEMRGGRVVFTLNLGVEPGRIASTRRINDGAWHKIVAERVGKTCKLTITSKDKEDDVTEGTTPGAFTVLELNPITTKLIFGAPPKDFKLPSGLISTPFVGIIEDVTFDGTPLGLWNFIAAENNYLGSKARDYDKEIFVEGASFDGQGYTVLSKGYLRIKPDRTTVSITFKTYAEDGLLLYMGKDDYFAVELRGGKLVTSFDSGGGPGIMSTQAKYNNGEWHTVNVDRNKKQGQMKTDQNTEDLRTSSPGTTNNLDTTDDIYIGGMDNMLLPHRSINPIGFDGCMKDITIGASAIDLFDNERSKGVIKGCIPEVIHTVTFPSSQRGYISLPPVNVGSMFDITFKMRTAQNDSLLTLITDQSGANTFSVYMKEGSIIVKEQLGTLSAQLSSKINTYGDGKWHYISIMKMGQSLSLNIDDREMLQGTQSVPGDLITDSPVYFGGLPTNLKVKSDIVPTTNGIVGCMGDITINKKFKNLVVLHESFSVTLDECALDKEASKEVTTTPSGPTLPPGECALRLRSGKFEDPGFKSEGTRYGSSLYSRTEYKNIGVRLTVKPATLSFKFKTTALHGVIFYTADKQHKDYLGIHMLNGNILYGFNCGSGSALLQTTEKYNDGKWHTVTVTRQGQTGILEMDGEKVTEGKSRGSTKSLNSRPPYYVGGIKEDMVKLAGKNLGVGYNSFPGCISTITVNGKEMTEPATAEVDTAQCSWDVEAGSFVGYTGGFVKLFDKYSVGKNQEISMQIRSRRQEGILLSVHSNGSDYLILQISQGAVVLTVDNGAGPITVKHESKMQGAICDGKWHEIRAMKMGNELELSVDGDMVSKKDGGNPKVTSADTSHPLFIAGVGAANAKGILATMGFSGCIRNIQLNKKAYSLADGEPLGDVRIGACPRD